MFKNQFIPFSIRYKYSNAKFVTETFVADIPTPASVIIPVDSYYFSRNGIDVQGD